MGDAEDRAAVIELIHRYAFMIDLHEYDRVGEVFAEDAVADYSSMASFLGDDIAPAGSADIARWLEQYTGHRNGMHFMHNHVVALEGDRASMRNYMHNVDSSICGMYHTEAARTPDGWRLTSLRLDEHVVDPDRVP